MLTTATDLAFQSATELTARLRARELSSCDLLRHFRARIEKFNPSVNAVITFDEHAFEQASAADAMLGRGESWGPLHGLPITIKDSLETAGLRTTAGAPEYAAHVSTRDADAVARLRAAGAIVFGKTNLPAYAADCQTFNPIFGTTRNPWNLDRAVGGSSGGAAAAVAAGLTGLDLGSDLGGSIRNPAGYCGVFGLRPSYGIIPTRGHIPGPAGALAELDMATLGPLARAAADLGLALDVLAGPDAAHAVGWRLRLPPPRADSLPGYRFAMWLDDEYCPVDVEVLRVLGSVVESLRNSGARIAEARPCPLREAERLAQRLIQAVFSGAHPAAEYERLCAVTETASAEDDSPPVRHARNVTTRSRDHNVALEARAQLAARCSSFFAEFDVILSPITPTTAIPHDHQPDVDARRIVVNGVARPYGDQIPWASLAGVCGLPAVVVPAGRARDGLPVGLQVIGPFLEDRTVIDVAERIAELIGGFTPPPGY